MTSDVEPGFRRVFTDHTGRFYEDIVIDPIGPPTLATYNATEIYNILAQEITAEIDRDILNNLFIEENDGSLRIQK